MKFITKTVREVEAHEVDFAVAGYFGVPYSVVVALGASNNTQHAVTVEAEELDDWDQGKLEMWQNGGREGHSPQPRVVLSVMARAGVIPAGEYLIDICW
ncbi:hypothetical protein [Streptomyces sp. 5-10]|uniref:hypothetical protein n=1 Tax=Streptomyces sp. 5-10 TaxID=878925 RepID=UPI00168C0286|nr:hypothetical protein [Streptomyces sp. 5-10]MBD3004597.1 hypothetical protein [Streptomyces sp. 5-10]